MFVIQSIVIKEIRNRFKIISNARAYNILFSYLLFRSFEVVYMLMQVKHFNIMLKLC